MPTTPSNPNAPRAGGLLARLKGLVENMKPNDDVSSPEEVLPTWDVKLPPAPGAPADEPVAVPESPQADEAIPVVESVPSDEPNAAVPVAQPAPEEAPAVQPAEAAEAAPAVEPLQETLPEIPSPLVDAAAPPTILCPICGAARKGDSSSCDDCGYYFSAADLARGTVAAPAAAAEAPAVRLQNRYEVGEQVSDRFGVVRFRGLDHGDGSSPPAPVVIVRQAAPRPAEEIPIAEAAPVEAVLAEEDEEIVPVFDDVLPVATTTPESQSGQPVWPSLEWEQGLLSNLENAGLPAVLDRFTEGEFEYLVEEVPAGTSLWEAWDDPDADSRQRYGYLASVAEILHQLHQYNTILEGLRPEIIVIAPEGRARLTDLGDLLPLPLPADLPLRRTLYTAPEVLAGKADARADLYSFGAMLYALHVGRDVNEIDFNRDGTPKPFIPRFPDIHPAFGRLMSKTFRKDVEGRFPSDEAAREDVTGCVELIRTLQTIGRTLDNVRLEIAAWTTTGMVRTGNEDAFALLHACESRQDDLSETALVLLCDGMGGYEAGEVAAALAIQIMRQNLVKLKPFAPLSGVSSFPGDVLSQPAAPAREGHAAPPIDVEEMKKTLKAALKEANKQIYTASRTPGSKRRGMGCTAEAVYIDGRNIVVGHVGDSRTYHLHEGRLIQMTRDQTLVNRLVELGTLSPEEAETHPRRNELQQAIGGQPDVEPGVYSGTIKAGDWVVVCSDGLTNHVTNADLEQMLRGEGYSAETVARRLVNLANLQGATDNATVVVIRAT
ncbi:MAG TPA: protein phosphatase 2C domain-containing protein [Gemmataceae bacterium]|jgi:protein phosphatase